MLIAKGDLALREMEGRGGAGRDLNFRSHVVDRPVLFLDQIMPSSFLCKEQTPTQEVSDINTSH